MTLPDPDPARPDEAQGLYRKYDVRRSDPDAAERHADCRMFVLDVDCDPAAVPAITAYATAIRDSHPQLANDLDAWVDSTRDADVYTMGWECPLPHCDRELHWTAHRIGPLDGDGMDGLTVNPSVADTDKAHRWQIECPARHVVLTSHDVDRHARRHATQVVADLEMRLVDGAWDQARRDAYGPDLPRQDVHPEPDPDVLAMHLHRIGARRIEDTPPQPSDTP